MEPMDYELGASPINIIDEYYASTRELPEPATDFFTPMF